MLYNLYKIVWLVIDLSKWVLDKVYLILNVFLFFEVISIIYKYIFLKMLK